MIQLLSLFICLFSLVSHSAAAVNSSKVPAEWDIRGVQAGMTPDEALTALSAAMPGKVVEILAGNAGAGELGIRRADVSLRVGNGKIEGPRSMIAVRYGVPDSDVRLEQIEVTFSSPPTAPTAVAVVRNVKYLTSKGPAVDSIKAALINKYGEPTGAKAYGGRYDMSWSYDDAGAAISGVQATRKCASASWSGQGLGWLQGNLLKSMPTCGYGLAVTISSGNGITVELNITMVDGERLRASVQQTLALREQLLQEALTEQQKERESRGAPEL